MQYVGGRDKTGTRFQPNGRVGGHDICCCRESPLGQSPFQAHLVVSPSQDLAHRSRSLPIRAASCLQPPTCQVLVGCAPTTCTLDGEYVPFPPTPTAPGRLESYPRVSVCEYLGRSGSHQVPSLDGISRSRHSTIDSIPRLLPVTTHLIHSFTHAATCSSEFPSRKDRATQC